MPGVRPPASPASVPRQGAPCEQGVVVLNGAQHRIHVGLILTRLWVV